MKPNQSMPTEFNFGDVIGERYRVYGVSSGGMGNVYLCLTVDTETPYALKTFQLNSMDNRLVARNNLEDEVKIWIDLGKHQNIVQCHWMEFVKGKPYIVLEWVVGDVRYGTTLRDYMRNKRLDVPTSIDFIADMSQGLAYAQQKSLGLVHQDLKPENILVDQLGIAKITDFGLASIVKSKNELKTEKPKPKKVKKQLKRPVRKIKKQPKQLDLSSISIEDLIAEATKRGYRMTKIQKLNKKQIKLLKNTVDDLDMLSDDEE